MKTVTALVEGYRAFHSSTYAPNEELYRTLAARGQAPETMVIACCDSRADPALIFDAKPGELFVVRNVANLVPPFEPHGIYHGTSAAIEFAVIGLKVRNILVLGHARCGGVKAFLDGRYGGGGESSFIAKWISLLKPAHGKVLREQPGLTPDEQQPHLEHAAIRTSLENLQTFPFVNERVAAGELSLHGGYFDIASGELLSLDPASRRFEPVD